MCTGLYIAIEARPIATYTLFRFVRVRSWAIVALKATCLEFNYANGVPAT